MNISIFMQVILTVQCCQCTTACGVVILSGVLRLTAFPRLCSYHSQTTLYWSQVSCIFRPTWKWCLTAEPDACCCVTVSGVWVRCVWKQKETDDWVCKIQLNLFLKLLLERRETYTKEQQPSPWKLVFREGVSRLQVKSIWVGFSSLFFSV